MISNIFSEYSSKNLEKWEKLKHRYNKQHITEKSNGSMMKLNNESENVSRQMKIQLYKIYVLQQKAVLKRSS